MIISTKWSCAPYICYRTAHGWSPGERLGPQVNEASKAGMLRDCRFHGMGGASWRKLKRWRSRSWRYQAKQALYYMERYLDNTEPSIDQVRQWGYNEEMSLFW